MSRFFAAGYTSDTSSEEEDLLSGSEELMSSSTEEFSTDSEFDNDSDDSDSEDEDYSGAGVSYFLKKDFLKGSADSDSDSDNEGRKVVKSGKEKLLDDMREMVGLIYNSRNLENWSSVLTEFDKLGRTLIRANQQNIAVPNFYYKMLGELEETLSEAASQDKKKLPTDQNRSFNTMKQRVKKAAKEYQVYLDYYKENPTAFDTEEPLDIAVSNNDSGVGGAVVGSISGTTRSLSPVFHTLKQISESRGKKNIDKVEQVAVLEKLLQDALPQGKLFEIISVYQMLLSVRFDASSSQSYMPIEAWKQNEKDFADFLSLLEKHADEYCVSELGIATDDIDIEPPANEKGVKVILGSVAAIVERLDDEFTRSLQNTDPHSIEYVDRLKDEPTLYSLIVRAQVYVESTTSISDHLARIVLRRLDHIYFKPDQLIAQNESVAWESTWDAAGIKESLLYTKGKSPSEVVAALTEFLSKQDSKVYNKQALLCKTYYYAVNNRYADARELFLNSQIYNNINSADSASQVLYNRALVQLGLGAFKAGKIEESHQILNEIVNTQRLKELLGQGYNSKYPSQVTAAEKSKLLPFHMHINLELVECVFMTSSMLIEIPALAASATSPKDNKRKASIKSFKSKLEFHERQYFTGPPESIKDHLIYASRYLQKGNWDKAYQLLSSIKIWRLFADNDSLLSMLKHQLQIEGLRTYIFTYKSIFTKLSVQKLSKQFDIEKNDVQSIIEKMLTQNEISGSLDESKEFVNFTTDEPQRSKLQELASIMNEKLGLLLDKNEKTASNGHSRKQTTQQQQQQQKEQKEQKETQQEENSKFRHANVNTNNDEFQVTA
ncbi:uncharacterized protein CXQ87_001066 [Candidozyma duobushaemuli]|uniref:Eukaryotic translation initiation factor 3 subunit C n=2 Tax=Candidozyma TaxID=3303203 RepID=A0ABX8I7I1_9ASCO|nr:uncharacterized protein CXQ87_001066 [[Candida] duobushaemulonis]PVH18149.1 hypothetical protein CXQ87_001066 [[Candida] duobushaemulonis]QWU86711.1 hypothetical protein CA3LBN_000929 [[Candida] haemuloni]